ncbi:hypothetical protein E4U56_003358 [Claviceps arundinis]|uniref:Zn(2)-C6 fungal-type domain-containing protein n=1 Tax=Claviceps arundinis TaxID=1623583 RepID=A0A9P7MYZ6_9HYPO|nr:hypothetical protein E4U56_003358 [Claviceps arundinis]
MSAWAEAALGPWDKMGSPDDMQMHDFQPHLNGQSCSPSSQSQSSFNQPPAAATASPNRGLVIRARYPTACQECRRRKQKCSLTHPCTNCARRFPQPACEYGPFKTKRQSWGSKSPRGTKDGGTQPSGGGFYSHLDLDAIHDAILDVEGGLDLGAAVDNVSGIQSSVLPPTYLLTHREKPVYSMRDESWAGGKPFLMKFRDSSGLFRDRALLELVQFIMQTRLRVANRIVQDEWEIDGKQLVRALHSRSQPSHNLASLEDQMQRLPMEPTKMNKELVRTHLQLLSRFKASLDGSPRPNNRFMRHWIPFSIQDKLVLHVVLCTTASFLNETGRLPKVLLHIHRATTTSLLNEYISSPTLCTSDSAILAVYQLILTSWYWGSTEELHAHMAGFKRMIQLRGGCQNLGMEGFTSKIALINDVVIALCHDTEPLMFGQPGFEYDDPCRVPLQVSFNSPLLFDCPPFSIPSSSLRLHKTTSEMLDRMRTLFQAVTQLPLHASPAQLLSLSQHANSVLCFLQQLPEEVLLHTEPGYDDAIIDTLTPTDADGDSPSSSSSTGQKRKRQDLDNDATSSDHHHHHSNTRTRLNDSTVIVRCSPDIPIPPDMVYICVRLTALIWAQAILQRVPTSQVCTQAQFIRIWSYAWAAGLDRWSSLSGVFAWMNIAIAPLCHRTIHARMVKTLTVTTFTYMGTENWHVAMAIASVGLHVQAWLRGGHDGKPMGSLSAAFGGEKAIEDFGFAFKENVMDLPDHRYVNGDEGGEEEGEDDGEFSRRRICV